jgi:hypothetical protein
MKLLAIAAVAAAHICALGHQGGGSKEAHIVQFDNVSKAGSTTVEFDIRYYNEKGKLDKIHVAAKVDIVGKLDATAKRLLIEPAVKKAADKAYTGGIIFSEMATGNVMVIAPNANEVRKGTFVEGIKVTDTDTSEHDKIIPPGPKAAENDEALTQNPMSVPNRPGSLAVVGLRGDIVGLTKQGPTGPWGAGEFGVTTDLGRDVIPLEQGMTNQDALEALRAKLTLRKIVTWCDGERLYILVDDRVGGVGAGIADAGASSFCMMLR